MTSILAAADPIARALSARLAAFARERQIKEWKRLWKLRLIEAANPTWADLYETLNG